MNSSTGRKQVVAVLAVSLAVVTLLAGFLGYSYLAAQSEYQSLKSEYQSLKSEYESLAAQATALRNDQNQLQLQLEKLQTIPPSVNVSEVQVGVRVFQSAEASLVFISNKQQGLQGLAPVASGSGFTYDSQGHVITNNHVVEGADAVDVTFPDGTVLPVEDRGRSTDFRSREPFWIKSLHDRGDRESDRSRATDRIRVSDHRGDPG